MAGYVSLHSGVTLKVLETKKKKVLVFLSLSLIYQYVRKTFDTSIYICLVFLFYQCDTVRLVYS